MNKNVFLYKSSNIKSRYFLMHLSQNFLTHTEQSKKKFFLYLFDKILKKNRGSLHCLWALRFSPEYILLLPMSALVETKGGLEPSTFNTLHRDPPTYCGVMDSGKFCCGGQVYSNDIVNYIIQKLFLLHN